MLRHGSLLLVLSIAAGTACSNATAPSQNNSGNPHILVADGGGGDRLVGFKDMTGTGWQSFATASPGGIALDGSGRIYVTDALNNQIVRINDLGGGGRVTFGGTGTGTDQFKVPSGIAIGPDGKIYVLDAGNSRIVRFDDMSGTNWTTFGTHGSGVGQLFNPAGFFVDGAGKIYHCEFSTGQIVRMDDMSGANWVTYGSVGSGAGQFSSPRALFVDGAGRIFVADDLNDRVVRIDDMSGTGWAEVSHDAANGAHGLLGPAGVWVSGGKLYISSYKGAYITQTDDDMTGNNWVSLGTKGPGTSQFNQPFGIVVH
jgi:DNA-binding beta-propeller fold protein YncE